MSLVASHQKLVRFSSNEQKNYATAVSTCRLGRTSHRDEISCPTYRPIFPQLGSFTWQHKVDKLVLVRPKPPSTDSVILESMKLSSICSMYGIYANIGGILMVNNTIYSSTMDPMGQNPDCRTSKHGQSHSPRGPTVGQAAPLTLHLRNGPSQGEVLINQLLQRNGQPVAPLGGGPKNGLLKPQNPADPP